MIIDVSEGINPALWAILPTDDRVLVGGRTVWIGPFDDPLMVAQPNRWGVIESGFPDLPCLVEVDSLVSGHLPMPENTIGYVDRAHHPVPAPAADPLGARLIASARSLSKAITQIRGVTLAATPFARTIPLITPVEADDLVSRCRVLGVLGLRPLEGLGGGVALTVRETHREAELERIVDVLASVVEQGR